MILTNQVAFCILFSFLTSSVCWWTVVYYGVPTTTETSDHVVATLKSRKKIEEVT